MPDGPVRAKEGEVDRHIVGWGLCVGFVDIELYSLCIYRTDAALGF